MLQRIVISGITVEIYDVLNYVGIAVLYIWVILQSRSFVDLCPIARRQATEKKRRIVAAVVFLLITIVGILLLILLNQKFGDWFTNGNKNYYGSLTAWFIVFMIVPTLLKISPLGTLDLLTPGLPLSLTISKLACVFFGCCYSFEMPGSFYYNQNTLRYEFPVQIVETAVAFLIFLFLLWYRKKPHMKGNLFPLYVIVYSATRFFIEFLRADLGNVIGIFDAYQIMSAVYVVLGLIFLRFIQMHQEQLI